jgi:hypothetical protein
MYCNNHKICNNIFSKKFKGTGAVPMVIVGNKIDLSKLDATLRKVSKNSKDYCVFNVL